jgi:hypothetical protein
MMKPTLATITSRSRDALVSLRKQLQNRANHAKLDLRFEMDLDNGKNIYVHGDDFQGFLDKTINSIGLPCSVTYVHQEAMPPAQPAGGLVATKDKEIAQLRAANEQLRAQYEQERQGGLTILEENIALQRRIETLVTEKDALDHELAKTVRTQASPQNAHEAIINYLQSYTERIEQLESISEGTLEFDMNLETLLGRANTELGLDVETRNDLLKFIKNRATATALLERYNHDHPEEYRQYITNMKDERSLRSNIDTMKKTLSAEIAGSLIAAAEAPLRKAHEEIARYEQAREQYITTANAIISDYQTLIAVENDRERLQEAIEDLNCMQIPLYFAAQGSGLRIYAAAKKASKLYAQVLTPQLMKGFVQNIDEGLLCYELTAQEIEQTTQRLMFGTRHAFAGTQFSKYGMELELLWNCAASYESYTVIGLQERRAALEEIAHDMHGKNALGLGQVICMAEKKLGGKVSRVGIRNDLRKLEEQQKVTLVGPDTRRKYRF